ncbi:MAG: TenA family protein, partial [Cyanobacteria bacterium P01_H01_bin.121]
AGACPEHPFVQGIATGQLQQATFAYYVGQDAFFLEAFARAYSICAAKAPNWQAFSQFHQLAAGVLSELQLHGEYARQWQVDLQAVTAGAATQRYVDFLLATAWGQPLGLTTVAMAPCMRLYAFLGERLAQRTRSEAIQDHAYTDWIQTYSSDEFLALVQQLEELVNQYAPQDDVAERAYRYAMQCELDFFQAAWEILTP